MMTTRQNIIIKGTKNGLSLQLNDACSYETIITELKEKLTELQGVETEGPKLSVRIDLGYRYLTDEQKDQLRNLINHYHHMIVEDIESNVITKVEAQKLIDEQEITSFTTIVRSGQILEVDGDLLLIGDVNPGATVRAGGNIYIMGALKGVAHAGYHGRRDAVIIASFMIPSQLRIHDCISRAPDHYEEDGHHQMECAYINDENQIIIDRLQVLKRIRPEMNRLKGGL